MMRPPSWIALWLGTLALAPAVPARADVDAQTRAAAERLFDEGLARLAAGDTKEACAKLEKAVELTERKAAGGLIQLGHCWEKLGRTASAWATFREAESLAASLGQADREREATTAAAALAPKLAHVRVRLAAPVAGARVTRDGAALPEASRNEPLPVDPGPHIIEVTAPGHLPRRVEIDVKPGPSQLDVEIPALVASPPAAPVGAGSTLPGAPIAAPPGAKGETTPWSTLRILGLSVSGAGAVTLGASLGVILAAKSDYDTALAGCDTTGATPRCPPGPRREVESARGQGDVATGIFVAGAAVIAAGVIIAIVAPPAEPDRPVARRPAIAPAPASASLRLGVGSVGMVGSW